MTKRRAGKKAERTTEGYELSRLHAMSDSARDAWEKGKIK